jgi:truncated hemoglobin YjbI
MFEPTPGYMTELLKKEFLDFMVPQEFHNVKDVQSLHYSDNNTKKLYFWQLYSLLGEEKIKLFITNFYKRIFNDYEDKKFLETFKELGSLKKHIHGQTNFWLDCMGGGQLYAGGEKKLHFHHTLAKDIMNRSGAQRWLMHMKNTLYDKNIYLGEDPRVRPCIIEFVNFFMKKYGQQFNFTYSKI